MEAGAVSYFYICIHLSILLGAVLFYVLSYLLHAPVLSAGLGFIIIIILFTFYQWGRELSNLL